MSLSSEIASALHTGNGVATNFPHSFKVLSADHIRVTRIVIATGAGTVVASSDYTLNGVGADSGSIDYLYLGSPLPATHQLLVERIVPYTQELTVSNGSAYLPETLEAQLDLMVMQIQQLKQAVADLVDGGTIVSLTGAVAGPASAVANRFAAFDGTSGTLIKDSTYSSASFSLAGHSHAFGALTGVPTTVSGYGITDIPEYAVDAVAAAFTLGVHSGITVTYDDPSGAISLAATGNSWTDCAIDTTYPITNNTVLADDPDLQFTMAANTTYAIEACLYLSVSSVSGHKFGITGPAAPTRVQAYELEVDDGGNVSAFDIAAYGQLRNNTPAGNEETAIRFFATIENGANPGTFALQVAQNASSATALNVRKGSWLRYRTV